MHPPVDANGMSGLAHACDQSGWSQRAALAADDLIQMASRALINQVIKTNERGFPNGYSCIHLLAGGVDRNRHRPGLMKCLIERRAYIEAKTARKPYNTAMTLAAGQGCGTMWKVLQEAGADVLYRNYYGKGQLELAKCCSSTVAAHTKAANVPDTYVPTKKRQMPQKT